MVKICFLRYVLSSINTFRNATSFKSVLCYAFCLALSIETAYAVSPQREASSGGAPASKPRTINSKTVVEGIMIESSVSPVDSSRKESAEIFENESVRVKFKITYVADATPVIGLHPAAWLDLRQKDAALKPQDCVRKISAFLSASALDRQPINLNAYYALNLNADSTISVIDPLNGFGGSKLLALIVLKSPGEDWALTADHNKLFVSMPESNQVAVVDTETWKITANINVGLHPTRLALQPDQQYLWVANGATASNRTDSGVTVLTTSGLKETARIPTGKGYHEIAFSDDNRFAFITNKDDDTISIIDIRQLKKVKDVYTGAKPASIAFSNIAKMAYVANEGDGTIVAVTGERAEIIARMKAESGLGQIKLAPGGRYGFVVNPAKGIVHILDVSSNRIIQSVAIEGEPDQVAFTNTQAYIRRRQSETVLMIALSQIGVEGKPISLADFPGGQHHFGNVSKPSPADSIVQVPGESAVLVANPADKAVYYYAEGMAAPMGNFNNSGQEPRAVIVVDRSLKEQEPGVYTTVGKLRGAGLYDLAFLLNSPRIVHCFEVPVQIDRAAEARNDSIVVSLEPLLTDRVVKVASPVNLQFRLTNARTKQLLTGLKDVQVLAFLAPGIWQKREYARESANGVYGVNMTLPRAGVYYVYVSSESLGLKLNNPQYLIIEARSAAPGTLQ